MWQSTNLGRYVKYSYDYLEVLAVKPIGTRDLADAVHGDREDRTGPDAGVAPPPSTGARWDTPPSSEPTSTAHLLLDCTGADHRPEAARFPANPSHTPPSRDARTMSQPPVDAMTLQRMYHTALWGPPAEQPERCSPTNCAATRQLLPELAALLPRVQGAERYRPARHHRHNSKTANQPRQPSWPRH